MSPNIILLIQNFVFAIKFDNAAQQHWITIALFSMFLDIVAFSVIKISMIWMFPKPAFVIALLVFIVGTIAFAAFCGDKMGEDNRLVLLSCSIDRF